MGAKINPVVGCAGGGGKESKRERYAAKCVDRTICFHLIYQETQLCGCSPRGDGEPHIYYFLCG
jgi:hypothetical protein